MHRGFKFAFAALLFGLAPIVSTYATQIPARDIVARNYDVLIGVMKEAKTLGFDGRVERLKPLVEATFDLALMARTTAAAYWGKATDEQRNKFVEAFGRMTAVTLADRFDGYDGEKFDVLGTEEQSGGFALVKSRLIKSDGEPVQIDYLMKDGGGGWKVADVYANGAISELAVKTADYAAVLRSGGIEALTAALEKKADALAGHGRQAAATNTP